MTVPLFAVLGLIFGSFATVAAHRIPKREDIVRGRSRCPNCGRTVRVRENIPVASWVVLRGRCPGCGERISVRYPLIELTVTALFVGAALRFGASVEAFVFAAFFWVLVVLTAIDLEHKLLPDRVVFPSFVVGWMGLAAAAATDGDMGRLLDAAVGAAIFGGFFLIVGLIVPAGMGGGDVKLAFVLGSFLGYVDAPGAVLVGMFLSFLIGGVVGIGVMVVTGGDRKTQVPFGPFLAAGSIVAVFAGEWIADKYAGLI